MAFDPDEFVGAYGKRATSDPPTAPPAPAPTVAKAPEDPGRLAAFGYGAARGASLGFVDRLAGLGTYLGDTAAKAIHPDVPKKDNAAYQEGRSEYLGGEKVAAEAHPGYNLAGQVIGGVVPAVAMSPVGAAARAAAAGRGTLARTGALLAQPAAEGALFGVGNTPRDVPEDMITNALTGATIASVAAGGGELAKRGVKSAAETLGGEGLKRRILNEVAEGTSNVTPTGRKRLDAAGERIVSEIVTGPDAKAVRSSYLSGSAEKGRDGLEPIIAKVGQKLDRAYGAFEEAGQHKVNLVDYLDRLRVAADDALASGNTTLQHGIAAFDKEIRRAAADSGQELTLRQLRGMTTNTQRAASSVLGGLNEHATAKLKRQISAVASEEMGETLAKQAGNTPALKAAVQEITKNNPRMSALLTLDDALKLRLAKESTAPGMLMRAGKFAAAPAAAVGLSAIASGDEGKLQNMATLGLLGLGAVPAARTAERAVTSAAIRNVQRGIRPRPPTALARGIGGTVAGSTAAGQFIGGEEE